MSTLTAPLTHDELAALADEDGFIEVNVLVNLDEIIDNDLEGLLDILCERVGASLLMDINYSIVKAEDSHTLVIAVNGDVTEELQSDYS